MGHANYTNLSTLWNNLLFAKGKITLRQAIDTAIRRKETVHASEGEYDDEGMLAMAFGDIISLLTSKYGKGWGRDGGGSWPGPWIEPVWDVWWVAKQKVRKNHYLDPVWDMLVSCERCLDPEIETRMPDRGRHTFAVAADAVQETFGDGPWPQYLRRMPDMRVQWENWWENWESNGWADDEEDWKLFESILFRYCPGWRKRYKEVPVLGNVTH